MVLSPLVRGRKGFHKEVIAGARRLGYRRARIDGKLVDLRAPEFAGGLERFKEHNIDIVIGKAKAGGREVEALIDQGLRLGQRRDPLDLRARRTDFQSAAFLPRLRHRLRAARPAAVFLQQPARRLQASAPAWALPGISILN